MSSLFKRLFNSSSSKSNSSAVDPSSSSSNGGRSRRSDDSDGFCGVQDEQKRKKLLRRLALAEADPEPLLDLSDFELVKLPEQVYTLVKVYNKRRLHLERNALQAFSIPPNLSTSSSSTVFAELTVLHLEENKLSSFTLDTPAALASLKELYLSGNKLTCLPPALFSLPRLQVLALRDNLLAYFPLELLERSGPPALTYLDLAYNQIEELPVEALIRQADPQSLATLVLEGNPLQRPPIECLLEEEGDSDDGQQLVTSFAQIDARLRRYYQVERGVEVLEDEGKEEKVVESKRVTQCDSSMTAVEDEDDDDVDYNNEADDMFARYAAKKLESKQSAIEWERAYQASTLELEPKCASTIEKLVKGKRLTDRDKLLRELVGEQEALFTKINQFTERKDAEKQRVLDSCFEQLQEHSSLLIEKLNAEQKSKGRFAFEDEHEEELNGDIGRLLAQYDAQLGARREALLSGLVEDAQEENVKLAATVRRKDDQHSSRTRELERQDQSLSTAFEAVLAARDRRNGDLSERISLVESELLALTYVERERTEARTGDRLAALTAQRQALAALLAALLEEKRSREKKLMATLESELEKRFSQETDSENEQEGWLEHFQRLLTRESFEVQVESYGVDARVADVLVGLYKELGEKADDDDGHASMLQGKLLYYLGHFVDVPVDRLLSFTSPSDLLRLNIDDYELCGMLVERFRRYREEGGVVQTAASSAPVVEKLVIAVEEETETEVVAKVEAAGPGGEKLWYEAECVICLDNSANIVFLPCGHICTCQRCIRPNASSLSLCPLCRAEIDFMQAINITT